MTIDYKIKGTKLPNLPKGTEYRCIHWNHDTESKLSNHAKKDLISFGYTYRKGYIYILYEEYDYFGTLYYMTKLNDIEKLTKQETMTKTITYSDAQRIVDIACTAWANTLFDKWGRDIVLKRNITISEEDYNEMRQACSTAQHKVFDAIFGEDKPKPQFKVGDWVIGWFTTHTDYQNKAWEIGHIDTHGYIFTKKNSTHNCKAKDIRLATEEEIKAANTFPDGTPCLVRDNFGDNWKFYYADGKGEFYAYGRKSGISSIPWKHSMKLDIDNLPVNE